MIQVAMMLLVLAATIPASVSAWGEFGHEIVANIAWARLSSNTQTKLSSLLNITNTTLIQETGSPLAAVANWADHVRHFLPWSAGLHYIDVRDDLIVGGCHYKDAMDGSSSECAFDYDRDCPNDACVAGAIVNYSTQLLHFVKEDEASAPLLPSRLRKSQQGSTQKPYPSNHTIQALKFMIHFIGDIHQPLHASRTSDKGGNDISVKYHLLTPSQRHINHTLEEAHFRNSKQPSVAHHHPKHHAWNLHSIWDTALIETALERSYDNNRTVMEKDLQAMLEQHPEWIDQYSSCPTTDNKSADTASGLNITCVIHWGQESWSRALKYAYTKNEPWKSNGNQQAVDVQDGDEIDEEYYESRIEIVKEQLIAGGVRLAWTLEEIFGKTKNGALDRLPDDHGMMSLWATVNLR